MATTIVLSPKSEKRLASLASETGRSKASLLREMIERGLDHAEDYYLAVEVLERIRTGRDRVYTSTEVRRELGLDD